MALTEQEFLDLEDKARDLRHLIIDTVQWAGGAHVGGALSAVDILTLLYYKYLNIRPENPQWEDRDRFILSKGHIGVGLAPVLADRGYFDKERLKTYNHTGSSLGMHLDKNKVPGLDASTGSLGHGLPIALGTALAARYLKKEYKTWCLLGDGECNEGSVWEAAMAASHYKITNMITIVDRNQCMIDGRTEDVMALEPFADKWRAFGFEVIEVDGHNLRELSIAMDKALQNDVKPVLLLCNTIKGCGVEFISDDYKYHYASFDPEKVKQCKTEISKYHETRREVK
jgi:transketolase